MALIVHASILLSATRQAIVLHRLGTAGRAQRMLLSAPRGRECCCEGGGGGEIIQLAQDSGQCVVWELQPNLYKLQFYAGQ